MQRFLAIGSGLRAAKIDIFPVKIPVGGAETGAISTASMQNASEACSTADKIINGGVKPQHVVEEMKAAAAEGRYLAAVGQPHEAAPARHSCGLRDFTTCASQARISGRFQISRSVNPRRS
jgi:hypothetical protein